MATSAIQAHGTSSVLRPTRLVPLDETKAVRIYQRNLPHWQQDGCTYFVTFRLADSIPESVRLSWENERRLWLKARGIAHDGRTDHWRKDLARLPSEIQFQFHQHFNRQVQACLDRGLGACWLGRPDCLAALRSELFRLDGLRVHVGDFVIMPNHVHALLTPAEGDDLTLILKTIKGASAVECNRLVDCSGPFWQAETYDHIVRDMQQLWAYREYIAGNPQKAGIEIAATAVYRASWMDAWPAL